MVILSAGGSEVLNTCVFAGVSGSEAEHNMHLRFRGALNPARNLIFNIYRENNLCACLSMGC